MAKHGKSKTRIYMIYHMMKQRCGNIKHNGYKWYGAKGIKVSKEWNTFEQFYSWAMKNGYTEDLTIDRIDSLKDYEPTNCQWITSTENTIKSSCRESGNTKISIDEASEICEMYSTGKFTMLEIAKGFSAHKASIYQIIDKARRDGSDIPVFKGNQNSRKQIA